MYTNMRTYVHLSYTYSSIFYCVQVSGCCACVCTCVSIYMHTHYIHIHIQKKRPMHRPLFFQTPPLFLSFFITVFRPPPPSLNPHHVPVWGGVPAKMCLHICTSKICLHIKDVFLSFFRCDSFFLSLPAHQRCACTSKI